MNMDIKPLHPIFVGGVDGIDLRRPLTPEQVDALEAGLDRYAVLVFRDQAIDDDQQLAFSRNFGALEQAIGSSVTKPENRRLGMEFADVSNLGKDNRIMPPDNRQRMFNLGNQLWHSDSSFRPVPSKYSILSGRIVATSGGNTEFADMRAAYAALDDATKARVEDLACEHSLMHSRAQIGFDTFTDEERESFRPVLQPLVRTHPATGCKSLYLASHAGTIVGWPVPEAKAFLRDLIEHATQRTFVYAHEWRVNDLVMWDNRTTMHRVRPFDAHNVVRDMRRTTVAGEGALVAQAAMAAEGGVAAALREVRG